MRNPLDLLVRSTLLLALALPAAASDSISIKLKDGTVVKGKATSYDSQKKQLAFRTEQGQDVIYALDQLDARTIYMVNASNAPKDNARVQLQLANFARGDSRSVLLWQGAGGSGRGRVFPKMERKSMACEVANRRKWWQTRNFDVSAAEV